MSKISDGLRKSAKETFYDPLKAELNQAADHIEKLEAALREIDIACDYSGSEYVCRGIARKALEETCSD